MLHRIITNLSQEQLEEVLTKFEKEIIKQANGNFK